MTKSMIDEVIMTNMTNNVTKKTKSVVARIYLKDFD